MFRRFLTRLLALAMVVAPLAMASHAGQAQNCCGETVPAITDTAMSGECCATPAHDTDVCGVACLAVVAIAPAMDRTPAMMPPHFDVAPAASLGGLPSGPDPGPPKASFPV